MTNILGNVDLDKLKPGDILQVLAGDASTYQLEKIDMKGTVPIVLNLPEYLYRILKAKATLFGNSLEQDIVEDLDELMDGWVEAAGDEFEIQYKEGKTAKQKKLRAVNLTERGRAKDKANK